MGKPWAYCLAWLDRWVCLLEYNVYDSLWQMNPLEQIKKFDIKCIHGVEDYCWIDIMQKNAKTSPNDIFDNSWFHSFNSIIKHYF